MNQVFQRGITRARFSYSVDNDKMQIAIFDDCDLGSMSVTNDMEDVVDYIARNEQIDPRNYIILYRDTQGEIDGWDAHNQDFYFVGGLSFEEAFLRVEQESCNPYKY